MQVATTIPWRLKIMLPLSQLVLFHHLPYQVPTPQKLQFYDGTNTYTVAMTANIPAIPSLTGYATTAAVTAAISAAPFGKLCSLAPGTSVTVGAGLYFCVGKSQWADRNGVKLAFAIITTSANGGPQLFTLYDGGSAHSFSISPSSIALNTTNNDTGQADIYYIGPIQ
jgi:hypothetical protein